MNIIQNGLMLTVLGMGFVFAFLSLLIGGMVLSSTLIRKYFPEPEPAPVAPKKKPAPAGADEIAIAIAVATRRKNS